MELIFRLESLLWGGPLLVMLMGCHVFFTLYLRGPQRYTLRGIRLSLGRGKGEAGVSPFGALATSLAAAIGTGNIIGMASAVALGGPGAVFWCWVTGILGMATRYAETVLTLRYRKMLPEGGTVGGPMYVMDKALRWPRLGAIFSVLGVGAAFSTGAMIQSNAVGVCLFDMGVPKLVTAVVLTLGAGAIIMGGAKRIATVCEKLVPAMGALYLLGCLGVLYGNRQAILPALRLILTAAFTPRAAGGGFVASTLMGAMKYGTARGLFTNESGMGTGPMAAATAPCRSLEGEGLVGMTGVFWDTVVICAMTGITLVSAMVAHGEQFQGAAAGQMCALAFANIPGGQLILSGSLCIFAFATVVGWSHYGRVCWAYLFGPGASLIYSLCYLAAGFSGVFLRLETLWSLGGIVAGLMAVPNVISLVLLRKEIAPPRGAGKKSPVRRACRQGRKTHVIPIWGAGALNNGRCSSPGRRLPAPGCLRPQWCRPRCRPRGQDR